jgi:hypothetical protein
VIFAAARFITAMLVIWTARLHWPDYSYYMILRAIVCSVALWGAITARRQQDYVWLWTFGVIAVLFNPVLPVHLTRGIWMPINLATGIAFLVSLDGKIFDLSKSLTKRNKA